jgi:NAD(P)-dependent dehydrogenase (short-subunit alcohol dehydrogenase family)
MKARGAGRIVNFGSEVSDEPTDSVSLNYVAAKGAVRSLTRGLARQWGRYGITVNTMWPVAATDAQQAWARAFPDEAQEMIDGTALGRMGTPLDDIAPVVEFLLGDGAQFMSGATVPVNGGRAMP